MCVVEGVSKQTYVTVTSWSVRDGDAVHKVGNIQRRSTRLTSASVTNSGNTKQERDLVSPARQGRATNTFWLRE